MTTARRGAAQGSATSVERAGAAARSAAPAPRASTSKISAKKTSRAASSPARTAVVSSSNAAADSQGERLNAQPTKRDKSRARNADQTPPPASAPAAKKKAAAAGKAPAKKSGYSGQTSTGYRARSFYLQQEDYDRIKQAWWWTRDRPGGFQSLSALVAQAALLLVDELERAHNDGAPFPEVPASAPRQATREGTSRQSEAMQRWWAERLANEGKA